MTKKMRSVKPVHILQITNNQLGDSIKASSWNRNQGVGELLGTYNFWLKGVFDVSGAATSGSRGVNGLIKSKNRKPLIFAVSPPSGLELDLQLVVGWECLNSVNQRNFGISCPCQLRTHKGCASPVMDVMSVVVLVLSLLHITIDIRISTD